MADQSIVGSKQPELPLDGPYSVFREQNNAAAGGIYTPSGTFVQQMQQMLQQASGSARDNQPTPQRPLANEYGFDTPDSAEWDAIDAMERDALATRQAMAAFGLEPPPRHLRFTPTSGFAKPPVKHSGQKRRSSSGAANPGSGSGMRQRQLSHLGRTSMNGSWGAPPPPRGVVGAIPDGQDVARNPPKTEDVPMQQSHPKRCKTKAAALAAAAVASAPPPPPAVPEPVYDDDGSDSDAENNLHLLRNGHEIPTSEPVEAAPPPRELTAYLPEHVCESVARAGFPRSLYQWQAECLCSLGVLDGRNLVYCAPTSSGKSLVAEVLMLRRILTTRRPALLVLPFSLCTEKANHLQKVLAPFGFEVQRYYGSSNNISNLNGAIGVVVCTIEKANILINRSLEDSTVDDFSCVVIDELHMVGEEERGYQLELLLAKLRYAGTAAFDSEEERFDFPMGLESGTQIIGMSATLPNVDVAAKWLGAALYKTEFRPVPLRQYLKVGNEIRDKSGAVVRHLAVPANWPKKDSDGVAWLAHETVSQGYSALIFCGTRNETSRVAKDLANILTVPERLRPWAAPVNDGVVAPSGIAALLPDNPTRADLLNVLRNPEPGRRPYDEALIFAVSKGIGFHHAAMDADEKELVEIGFKCGALSVLCATSTLASGVNLPARRVIFKHPWVGTSANVLDSTKYQQMVGRAGRAGIDTEGESYLIAGNGVHFKRLETLMNAAPQPINSCLTEDKRGMRRAMLEVVASGAVASPFDVERYIKCTLFAALSQTEPRVVANATKAALVWLGDVDKAGFIIWEQKTQTFQPTDFGRAALASGLSPEQCLLIRDDLARARRSFVLTTELHLTYLCVPATEAISMHREHYDRLYQIVQSLNPSEKSVANKVQLDLGYLTRKFAGTEVNRADGSIPEAERVCRRFWYALILNDILQEKSYDYLKKKYNVDIGAIQGLKERAERYAGMVASFCQRIGWHEMEMLITKYQARVLHGVRPEIQSLVEIDFVQNYTARLLYSAGLRSPELVATTSIERIVRALLAGRSNGGTEQEQQKAVQQANRIRKAAKELLKRKAEELKKEAVVLEWTVEQQQQNAMQLQQGNAAPKADVQTSNGDGGGEAAAATTNSTSGGAAAGPSTSVPSAAQHRHGRMWGAAAPSSSLSSMPSAQPLEPDNWQFGSATGVIELTEVQHVAALRHLVESKYDRFSFMIHASTPSVQPSAGYLSMPEKPAAAVIPGRNNIAALQKRLGLYSGAEGAAAAAAAAAPVVAVAVSFRDCQSFYIPHYACDEPEIMRELAALFSNPRLEKVTFDLKGQLAALCRRASCGRSVFDVVPPLIDVRIAAFMLHPAEARLSDDLSTSDVKALGGISFRQPSKSAEGTPFTAETLAEEYVDPISLARATKDMPKPTAKARLSNGGLIGRRAAMIGATFAVLRPQLQLLTLMEPLLRIEMPLVPLLVEMESYGVGIARDRLSAELPPLKRRIEELAQSSYAAAGRKFNLDSPEDCSRVLFEDLRLVPPPLARLPSGKWSTKAEVLDELIAAYPRCPLPGYISLYRSLGKYYCSCEELLNFAAMSPVSRVYGSLNQTRCITGRLTMDAPNLHTVPKPKEYDVCLTPLDMLESEERRLQLCNMRRAIVAPPGKVLLCADYCQLELRLLAHLSKDAVLIAHFKSDGVDPFISLASVWKQVPVQQVTAEQRSQAKQCAYGIIYGLGPTALAMKLGLRGSEGIQKARELADSFLAALPGVKAWIESVKQRRRSTGEVRTLYGRVRRFNRGDSGDHDRKAVNTISQGSAADLSKLALVATVQALKGGDARLILQIHDEFVFEVDAAKVKSVAAVVKRTMEGIAEPKLAVPLRVKMTVGPNWGEQKELLCR